MNCRNPNRRDVGRQARRNRAIDCELRSPARASARGLSHVNAVISIFEAAGDRDTTTAYTDIHRLFQRGALTAICKVALAQHGPMNTRALVTHILAAKGLDGGDRVLAKSVAERLIHALRMQAKRRKIAIAGKERGVIVWKLVDRCSMVNIGCAKLHLQNNRGVIQLQFFDYTTRIVGSRGAFRCQKKLINSQ
jgi:hypothetical protein